jgi:hypothetical protein
MTLTGARIRQQTVIRDKVRMSTRKKTTQPFVARWMFDVLTVVRRIVISLSIAIF